MGKKSQPTLYRFYRSDLAPIVWDPSRGRILAQFVETQFYTKDKKVAQTLFDMGYPRISLDTNNSPEVLFETGKVIDTIEDESSGPTKEELRNAKEAKIKQAELADKAASLLVESAALDEKENELLEEMKDGDDSDGLTSDKR